ncbi:MAG TPA: hypothetical protein VEK07_10050 [Polyangiaceae bacterium]|nr:hypothetical protein [Polyangiaceae bacterium]
MAGALALGCNRETGGDGAGAASYGEAVGVELSGRSPGPPLAIAFAVTRGRDPRPMVPSLASALETVALQCPDFDRAIARGETARIELRATPSSLRSKELSAKRGGACVRSVLEGKTLTLDGTEPVDVVVDVRLASPEASTPW